MKYAVLAARILMGLAFLAAGMMSILHFGKPTQTGDAGLFLSILSTHGYATAVALVMLVGGLLLLVGRFVALGLVLLGPVIVNILFFHAFLDPKGLPVAVVFVVLELFLIVVYRSAFAGIFRADSGFPGSPGV